MPDRKIPTPIHLVDDDSETLLFLFDFLSDAGFQVSASSSSSDALACISRTHPKLVICDWEMPEINGLELLEQVKTCSPESRVILMAEGGGWLQHEEVIRRGGLDLLFKPCGRKAVLRAVERVLEGAR